VLWALGHHRLGESDGATHPGTARVDVITGSGMAPGAQHHGLREDNIVVGLGMGSQAWVGCLHRQQRHPLELGKMVARKGARSWSRTMARRLW
jgi:hypothetical protein